MAREICRPGFFEYIINVLRLCVKRAYRSDVVWGNDKLKKTERAKQVVDFCDKNAVITTR